MLDYSLGIPPSASNPIGVVLDAHPYNFDNVATWFATRLDLFWQIFPAMDCPD
jgi:hypothetical protein